MFLQLSANGGNEMLCVKTLSTHHHPGVKQQEDGGGQI